MNYFYLPSYSFLMTILKFLSSRLNMWHNSCISYTKYFFQLSSFELHLLIIHKSAPAPYSAVIFFLPVHRYFISKYVILFYAPFYRTYTFYLEIHYSVLCIILPYIDILSQYTLFCFKHHSTVHRHFISKYIILFYASFYHT
jgi:hypothetical protein